VAIPPPTSWVRTLERALGAYLISTDPVRLDVDAIHAYLSTESYWARGRSRERVARGIDNSLPFGLYRGEAQVGFARVVTDEATFAWIADVYVLAEHRGQGLGKALVAAVVEHPTVRDLPRVLLATADAHGLYEQYGFAPLARVERFMAIEASGAADGCAAGPGEGGRLPE
jgi:GNAT superfamily N-acetyltransferase